MKGILLPAIIENITSRRDNTLKVVLGSNELSPADAGSLFSLHNRLATVYISPADISQKELDQIDQLQPELGGKTQSQRIRNVLYKLFEQDNEGFKSFDEYYRNKTEKIIEHFKTQIA